MGRDYHRQAARRGRRASNVVAIGRARRDRGNGIRFIAIVALAAVLAFVAALWLLQGAGRAPGEPARAATALPAAGPGDGYAARFGLCHTGGGTNCVVDGDTFWLAGEKYRFAGIDTPETHPARCADEQARGDAATLRLQALLNAGAFSLVSIDRDTDRYGRKLRDVTRGGVSLGDVLIAEGLARPYAGGRRSWC
ncbi:MAG: thermonuclease family protein [Sphingomonadales bacterium]|nr:thermonuclease family protein [Sphingomonadales bacterium]